MRHARAGSFVQSSLEEQERSSRLLLLDETGGLRGRLGAPMTSPSDEEEQGIGAAPEHGRQ